MVSEKYGKIVPYGPTKNFSTCTGNRQYVLKKKYVKSLMVIEKYTKSGHASLNLEFNRNWLLFFFY